MSLSMFQLPTAIRLAMDKWMSRLTTIPSGTLFLIDSSDILKSQRHLRQHLHFSKFSTLTQVKFQHLNISLLCKVASYLDSETYSWDYVLRRCCLLILGFWTGIAEALYNMDWSLKSFPIEHIILVARNVCCLAHI